ncbi:MAG TPA: SEC-C domain-containing protein [Deltaproteobacteria bacterium]|nr:SEC-C domain-containing protein [Deltaproteobacteria bacterium]
MKKIGRNEPCPCGSGRKFKQCHLGKEDELSPKEMDDFTAEMSSLITDLPAVWYGRSREMVDKLDIKTLTGTSAGIRFVDLKAYQSLNLSGDRSTAEEKSGAGGILINVLKTKPSDPDNLYMAISPDIGDSALIHQLAHVLDYLGGSRLAPGIAKPLSFELGLPSEHLEHPHEFAYWLDYLRKEFDVQLDADDSIVDFLFENQMLIKGLDIEKQDQTVLKMKSEQMMRFLSERSGEIDALICELPGYIGSRVKKD